MRRRPHRPGAQPRVQGRVVADGGDRPGGRGGVELGFSAAESREVVMQTMRGALALLECNDTMPQQEIDKVTTPGGITLKGLEAMTRDGFEGAVRAGLLESR